MFRKLQKINLLHQLRLDTFKKQTVYIILIGIFIGANFLLSTLPLRLDLSSGAAYTLSPSSKKIITKLDNSVDIKLYVSSDLPTRLVPIKTNVVDLLNEYKRASNGKINIKILDPKKDATAQQEAKDAGIPELQFSQLEQDKYAVTSSYFGIAASYGNKKEVLPQVTDIESLEYNLTAAIYKMTHKELAKVGIMGKEEAIIPQQEDLGTLKQILAQQFEINYIAEASAGAQIDTANKVVMLFDNNNKAYSEDEIQVLKNYIAKNGNLIVFSDGEWVMDDLTTAPATHNLENLLSAYGIKLHNDLVLSSSAEMVNFGNQIVSYLSPYPFWLKTNNFNEKMSYFSNITQLTYPWVSALSLTKKDGIETKEVVKSTQSSWEQKNTFILNPQEIPQPKSQDLQEFLITAEAKQKNGGSLLVIPSSRFVNDRYLSRGSGNIEFVLNALNNFGSDGALSGIRQRAVSFYPIPDLPEQLKDIFKYANILLLPLLLAVYGGIRLMKRK
ncbi:MAG: GldG family protein [bacterium]|nr:GldG family protein [bacterium]